MISGIGSYTPPQTFGVSVGQVGTVVDESTVPSSAPMWRRKKKTDAAAAAPAPAAAAPKVTPKTPEKEWTILFYMNGNNQLSGAAISGMRQLEYVGSDDNINLVTQVARPKGALDGITKDWSGCRRYYVQHNGEKVDVSAMLSTMLLGGLPGGAKKIQSEVVEDMGKKVDMGDPQTLQEFVQWGMAAYPARRYMLVMQGPTDGVKGLMHDAVAESKMSMGQMREALEKAEAATGKKLNVVAINGSQGATMELAYELKDVADYLVGSQDVAVGLGAPMMMTFNEIKNASKSKVRDALTVSRFYTLVNSSQNVAAIDLSKMNGVKDAWNGLAQALLNSNISGDKIRSLAEDTQDFQGLSTRRELAAIKDAFHFAELVAKDPETSANANIKTAAEAVMAAVEGALVGDAHNGKYNENAHGMSVFMPTNFGYFRPDGMPVKGEEHDRRGKYDETRLAQDTHWTDVLDKMADDSAWGKALKALGMSEETVDRVSSTASWTNNKLQLVNGFASLAGSLNALSIMGGGEGGGFLVLNPAQNAYFGTYGAAVDAIKIGNTAVHTVKKHGDWDTAIGNVFDVSAQGAKAVANLSTVVPGLKPIAQTAAIVWFAMPWIKQLWGVYTSYKEMKEKVELSVGDNTTAKIALAATRHWNNQTVWDQVPRTKQD